jgi:hypothetical protein
MAEVRANPEILPKFDLNFRLTSFGMMKFNP